MRQYNLSAVILELNYNMKYLNFADIDECSIMHGVCGDGVCRNTPGNFECDCKEGYESSSMMRVCMGQ